jgi:hypothetical protein
MMSLMGEPQAVRSIPQNDPIAIELRHAVRSGDTATLRRLLGDDPDLATARLLGRGDGTSTVLHLVADWPGYFPNGPQIVELLLTAGADPNALTTSQGLEPGPGSETPLHYAASSDDVDVAEALIHGGADLEVPGGSIGTPLDNAVGYGCWHVARLLVARGARVEKAWHAAALGLPNPLQAILGTDPSAEDLSQAFWHACAGGQRRTAEYLLARGADITWSPEYAHGTALDAATGPDTRRENVITWLRGLGVPSARQP